MSNLPALSDRGYEIIKQLGCNREGGRITWQAKHKATEQKVIIKQFRFATADSSWSGYKAYQQEIEILKKLDHPHIPKYIDSFETSDGFCLVQAYQPGRSLAEIENLDITKIKKIAESTLEILVYLQQQIPPIFHRDIKPENIIVDDELNVYLIDFGLAKIGKEQVAASSAFVGTPGFIPPEQITQPTEASDLYALGVTLICLLTATKSGEVHKLIDPHKPYRLRFKHLLPANISPQFVRWLERMVEPSLKKRFPNASIALQKLRQIDLQASSFWQSQNWQDRSWSSLFNGHQFLGSDSLVFNYLNLLILTAIVFFLTSLIDNKIDLNLNLLVLTALGSSVIIVAEISAVAISTTAEISSIKEAITLGLSVPILVVFIANLVGGVTAALAMSAGVAWSQIIVLAYFIGQQVKKSPPISNLTISLGVLFTMIGGIALGFLLKSIFF